MSQKPETRFKTAFLKRLRDIPHSWFVKIEAGAVCGIPDILGCVCGSFVAVELKANDKNKPTKLQMHNLDLIRFSGGFAYVANPENAEWVIAQLKKIKPRLRRVN